MAAMLPSMARLPVPNSPSLLLLGRLDGRLQTSPAADIWLARARITGAAELARLAGVPVAPEDIRDWICGRTPPPRHSEGLNDPLSVAALFHFALLAQEGAKDAVASATLKVLRTLLDDRHEAELWGSDDLVRFGPAFRATGSLLAAPYPAPSFRNVAERLLAAHRIIEAAPGDERMIATADGRRLHLEPARFDTVWLLACHLPQALAAAGLTLRPLPSLAALPRFLPGSADALAEQLEASAGRSAQAGLIELDRLEKQLDRLPTRLPVTRRSKAPLLLRLELAYPGLRVPAIARLLGISPQGAAKMARLVRGAAAVQW